MPDFTPTAEALDVDFDTRTAAEEPASTVRLSTSALRSGGETGASPFARRYVFEGADLLGQGGMGLIRACRDRRIGRQVAVKTMRPLRSKNPSSVSRFLREACVQAQLEHPSIVPVYDLGGGAEGGDLYFTMKRIHGVTLREVLERLHGGDTSASRTFTRRKLLTAFVSVCHAVHYAHTRGVIHRDLKPVNVMLGPYGEVYVLDWGIARVLPSAEGVIEPAPLADGEIDPAATGKGFSIGTLGYMAPEQARGEEVDGRCDVHALGAILFEILTLERFVARKEQRAMMRGNLAVVEARPSVRAPQAGVPPELETAIVRATAPDPEERYASARELGDAVERFLDGDRDLERRRDLARTHVDAVRGALATLDDTEERARVLRELGRALSLDPANADAAGMLVKVLTSPPKEAPREVLERIEAVRQKEQRVALRSASLGMLNLVAALPFALLMRPRSLLWIAVPLALALGTIAVALLGARAASRPRAPHLPTYVSACATVACMCGFFGPLFLMPTILLAVLTIGMNRSDGRRTPLVIGIAIAALFAPLALEWLGILPPSYRISGGEITLLSRAVEFPPVATIALVLMGNVVAFLSAAIHIRRMRDVRTDVQQKLELQSWQLERLALSTER